MVPRLTSDQKGLSRSALHNENTEAFVFFLGLQIARDSPAASMLYLATDTAMYEINTTRGINCALSRTVVAVADKRAYVVLVTSGHCSTGAIPRVRQAFRSKCTDKKKPSHSRWLRVQFLMAGN